MSADLLKDRKFLRQTNSSAFFDENWQLEDLQIESIDILEENAWNELAEKIKQNMLEDIPSEVVKLNYREKAISEFIRSKIRKSVFKATDIKPVTFIHFYKKNADQM